MWYYTFFLLFLLLSFNPCSAQWTQSQGLWGAGINCMTTTDSSFLIGSNGNHLHLFKSNQQGWEEKDAFGLDFFKQGEVLFSQTWHTVYRSFDYGESWQELDVFSDNFMHATQTALFMPYLYRSYDYGDTWEDIYENTGLPDNEYFNFYSWENTLLIEHVYLNIFLISYDDGQTWISLTTQDLPLENYFFIQEYCTQNDEIWISTNYGIFRLPENKNGWIPVDTATIQEPAIFFEFHDSLFIGSEQGCHYFNPEDSNWIPRNNGLKNPQVYSFTSWNDTLYCSSYPGIYKMGHDGEWSLWNSELSWIRIQAIYTHDNDVWVSSFIEDPFPGPRQYNLFRSSDNGENFQELDSGMVTVADEMIMTDSLYYLECLNGFYISEDQGGSWESYNQGLDSISIYCIAINKQYCFAGTETGLYRSSNRPGIWAPVPNALGSLPVIRLALNDDILICFAEYDENTYLAMRSDDAGETFEPVCIDFNCNTVYNTEFVTSNFYCFGIDSCFYSQENGLEWNYFPIPTQNAFHMSFNPGVNCVVMGGGFYENFISITYNLGSDWIDISEGLPPPTGSIFPIEVHTINNQRIFTEVEYKGLWYRDDLLTSTRENDISGAEKMEAWPNPFNNDFYIKLNIPDEKSSILRIYDLQGRLLFNENVMLTAQTRIFPTNCTKPGMYILQVYTNDCIYTVKLIKN